MELKNIIDKIIILSWQFNVSLTNSLSLKIGHLLWSDLKNQYFYQSFNELLLRKLINQFLKFKILVDSMTIGINLWLIPQISEHWPKKIPGRFIYVNVWFKRPGVESILIPREGIVQAWITSVEVVKIRIFKL